MSSLINRVLKDTDLILVFKQLDYVYQPVMQFVCKRWRRVVIAYKLQYHPYANDWVLKAASLDNCKLVAFYLRNSRNNLQRRMLPIDEFVDTAIFKKWEISIITYMFANRKNREMTSEDLIPLFRGSGSTRRYLMFGDKFHAHNHCYYLDTYRHYLNLCRKLRPLRVWVNVIRVLTERFRDSRFGCSKEVTKYLDDLHETYMIRLEMGIEKTYEIWSISSAKLDWRSKDREYKYRHVAFDMTTICMICEKEWNGYAAFLGVPCPKCARRCSKLKKGERETKVRMVLHKLRIPFREQAVIHTSDGKFICDFVLSVNGITIIIEVDEYQHGSHSKIGELQREDAIVNAFHDQPVYVFRYNPDAYMHEGTICGPDNGITIVRMLLLAKKLPTFSCKKELYRRMRFCYNDVEEYPYEDWVETEGIEDILRKVDEELDDYVLTKDDNTNNVDEHIDVYNYLNEYADVSGADGE